MRIPPSFYHAIWRFLLFAAIEIVCIVMIVNNGIIQQYTIVDKLRNVQSFFWSKEYSIQQYTKLRETNRDIYTHNQELIAENEKLHNYISNIKGDSIADSLAAILNEDTSFTYRSAKVIKNKFNSSNNFIIINKGKHQGITEDMGVITPKGVVGIIRAAGNNNSYVLSSLNREQHISAKLGKSNTIGTLSWNGNSMQYATLNELPQHVQVAAGDTIYTSGFSSFFPANIPIGVAESSKIVNGMHRSVKVKMLQDFSLLDIVIVVKNKHLKEIDSLITANE